MYDKSSDIAALITSRICHDLASPLGAINNGLELLELSGVGHTPEMNLLQDSIDAANARIQFFRIAYGSASTDTMLSPENIQKVLFTYFAGKKMQANWEYHMPTPRLEAKLLLLLVQCLETALPYGGTAQISKEAGKWQLAASGRIVADKPIWQVFNNVAQVQELQSSQVHFELARLLALDLGRYLVVTHDERQMQIIVS